MDKLESDKVNTARKEMIDAFAELTTLAMRAGADKDLVSDLHGRFFDANVEMKNWSK